MRDEDLSLFCAYFHILAITYLLYLCSELDCFIERFSFFVIYSFFQVKTSCILGLCHKQMSAIDGGDPDKLC